MCTSHSFNLSVFSVETIQYSVKKNRYACTVGYNFWNCQGWPTNLYSNESLVSPLSEKHINFEFGQFLHTLKCLRVHFALLIQLEDQKKKYESTVGYNFRSFQGWPTNLYSNESLGSPLSEKHINFEFGQFLHTLKSLRVHLALIQLAGVLSGNNTIQREDQKRNMNLRLGIILEVFKGGRQIYIQMKA